MLGALALIGIGIFGIVVSARALTEGEISVIWSLLAGWGSLSSKHSRNDNPTLFWAATILYGGGGALLTIFGICRLLARHG